MNFTDSPYEPFMKQPAYHWPPEPTPAPKGTICEGCPYWRGLRVRDLLPGDSAEPGQSQEGEVTVWTAGS